MGWIVSGSGSTNAVSTPSSINRHLFELIGCHTSTSTTCDGEYPLDVTFENNIPTYAA
jgi:hypothetical protein